MSAQSDLTAVDAVVASVPARGTGTHPRLWAVVAAVAGPPAYYVTASALSTNSTPPLPPSGLVAPLTVVVALFGVVVVAAVWGRRWRVAVVLAVIAALPFTLVGFALLIAFGLGLVLMVPALPWWAVAASSARQLARDEGASGGPSARQRARRARGWSLLLVLGTVPVGLAAATLLVNVLWPAPVVRWAVIAVLVLPAACCLVLLVLVLLGRWGAAHYVAGTLLVVLPVAAFTGVVVGLTFLVLLVAPALLVGVHTDVLRAAEPGEQP